MEFGVKTVANLTEDVFRAIDYIDLDYGLECCADMLELYVQVVSGYVRRDNKLEALRKAFEEKNWESYQVNVHAVKSSSLLIGIKDLSEEAKSLEYSLKEDNLPFLLENHERIMNHYESVISDLSSILEEYNVEDCDGF